MSTSARLSQSTLVHPPSGALRGVSRTPRLAATSKDASAQSRAKDAVKESSRNITSMDHLRAIDHSMHMAQGWGLEMYLPSVRLLPGEALSLEPKCIAQRPIVVFRMDQLHAGFSGAWFLMEHVGLRGRCAWDGLHRKWNCCKNAADAAGFKGQPNH